RARRRPPARRRGNRSTRPASRLGHRYRYRSCRISSPGTRLVHRLVTTSGRVTSSGRSDGGANGPRDQSEKLQHPPEIWPAKLDERVANPEALVLAELIDDGLLALGRSEEHTSELQSP